MIISNSKPLVYIQHFSDKSFTNISGIFHYISAELKHTTTFFSLSDQDILSRGWRVIVDQVQINYHGRPMVP